jgi:hypothetical protein
MLGAAQLATSQEEVSFIESPTGSDSSQKNFMLLVFRGL